MHARTRQTRPARTGTPDPSGTAHGLGARIAAWPRAAGGPRLVLFDIDRTLLDTRGGNRRAMTRAGVAVFGDRFSLDGVDRSGRLDAHILRDAASRLGVEPTDAQFDGFRRRYASELEAELGGQRAMPGALAWVERLSGVASVTLGLVTGNFADAARIKLPAIGLDFGLFQANGFGDAGADRAELVGLARRRAPGVPAGATLIIGDTPRDVACARAHGCPCLGVATGAFGREVLAAAGASLVVDDLTTPAATMFMSGFLSGAIVP